MQGPVASVLDWTSAGVVVASLVGWVPPLATFLSAVWFGIQIYTWIVNKGWKHK